MDYDRQAWIRKRPGQASGSDHPRQPPSSQIPHNREGPPDYEEEVPIGMSQRGPPPPRDSRDYEEDVPIGSSQRETLPPQHQASHNRPSRADHKSRQSRQEPRSIRREPTADYEEEVPIGMLRREPPLPQRQASHRQSSRADQNPRQSFQEPRNSRQDSSAIRQELPRLSIHGSQQRSHQHSRASSRFDDDKRYTQQPQRQESRRADPRAGPVPQEMQQRSRQHSRASSRFDDDERYTQRPQRQPSRSADPRAGPLPRMSFHEPQMSRHNSRREESRFESWKASHR